MDFIDWVIEESRWDTVLGLNEIQTTQRRFPPYLQKTTQPNTLDFEDIRIYNRALTENECTKAGLILKKYSKSIKIDSDVHEQLLDLRSSKEKTISMVIRGLIAFKKGSD